MADRLVMGDGKLIVSKAGKDASDPLLTPGDTLFNSDWLFSGTIITAGVHVDSSPHRFAKVIGVDGYTAWEATTSTAAQVINFPVLPYVPTVLLIPLGDSRYWHDFGMLLWGPDSWVTNHTDYFRAGSITVTNSQITIPRVQAMYADQRRFREDYLYIIMGM